MKNTPKAAPLLLLVCLIFIPAHAQNWTQWALNPQHNLEEKHIHGRIPTTILANILYDPLVPDILAANGGDLPSHYQVPLVEGNDVYMQFNGGTYDVNTFSTETFGENKFTWVDKHLVPVWSFQSDWVPPGNAFDFWEPYFQPAISNEFIYVAGAGGTIIKLNKRTGKVVTRINPFGDINPARFTVSPLTVDKHGNIFFNVIELADPIQDFFAFDAVDSWIVRVSPEGSIHKASYKTLVPGAPGANDNCEMGFPRSQLPWPPSPDAVAPTGPCGTQRVALNIAPAIANDGTIYSVTRSHFQDRYAFLVSITPDLKPKWAASLRNRFHDGCDVSVADGGVLPPNGAPGGCRAGTSRGVDPATNNAPSGRVEDDASSTPTVAPDGTIFFGTFTRYNYAQGHLMHFAADGRFLGSFPFGWDMTAGIYQHDGTYSVVMKENHYNTWTYCGSDNFCPPDRHATNPASPPQFFITQLDPNLNVEWRWQNTNTNSCTRNADGSTSCVSDHPDSFEFCVNAVVIDANGLIYGNSEDGNLYVVNQGGTLNSSIFLQLTVGAAYTPSSMGPDGKIYTQNDGRLFVISGPRRHDHDDDRDHDDE